jgi:hypothetical protein
MRRTSRRLALGTLLAGIGVLAVAVSPAIATDGAARSLPAPDRLFAATCITEPGTVYNLFQLDAAAMGTSVGSPVVAEEYRCRLQGAWDAPLHTAFVVDHILPALGAQALAPYSLATIDLGTGVVTDLAEFTLADSPVPVDSIAISTDGRAYAVAGTELFTLDLATGRLAAIPGSDLRQTDWTIAFNPVDGLLYGISSPFQGLHMPFVRIDTATGTYSDADVFGDNPLDASFYYALQFDSTGVAWVDTDNDHTGFQDRLTSLDFRQPAATAEIQGVPNSPEGDILTNSLFIVPSVARVTPVEACAGDILSLAYNGPSLVGLGAQASFSATADPATILGTADVTANAGDQTSASLAVPVLPGSGDYIATVTSAGAPRGQFAFHYVCPQLASTGFAAVPLEAGGSLLVLAGLALILRRRPARA